MTGETRPLRADARRNRARIVEVARTAFGASGKPGTHLVKQALATGPSSTRRCSTKTPAGSPVREVGPAETRTMANGIARADVASHLLRLPDEPSSVRVAQIITSK